MTATQTTNRTTPRRSFPPAPREPHALVLRAHPSPDSFNSALADAYAEGLRAGGVSVTTLDTDSLDFDLRLRGPNFGAQPLEPALTQLQAEIAGAAHLVIASPVWWGSVPASLKGLIDRALLPGWAYRSDAGAALPTPGLAGRTGRLLLTMDAPGWWDRLVYGRSAARMLAHAVLRFVGVKVLGATRFTSIERSTPASRAKMLARAQSHGRADARAIHRGLERAARGRRAAPTSPPPTADARASA